MPNIEKEEGSTKWSIKLSRSKLVQHCIQLTITKNESNSKTAITFLVVDSRLFVNIYLLYYINLVKFCFCLYFTNQPSRLFYNSVGFQFEKSIQVIKNQI